MLNQQLNLEFQAWYKYTAMSAHCEGLGLAGCAHWFALQAEEERGHAMRIYRYILDQDKSVRLLPLAEPQAEFASVIEVFEASLASEQAVTRSLNELAGAAMAENDHATHIFLHWFVTEQVEEEASVRDVLDRLRLIEGSGHGLLLIDKELGERVPESEE
jgi:ferritin